MIYVYWTLGTFVFLMYLLIAASIVIYDWTVMTALMNPNGGTKSPSKKTVWKLVFKALMWPISFVTGFIAGIISEIKPKK